MKRNEMMDLAMISSVDYAFAMGTLKDVCNTECIQFEDDGESTTSNSELDQMILAMVTENPVVTKEERRKNQSNRRRNTYLIAKKRAKSDQASGFNSPKFDQVGRYKKSHQFVALSDWSGDWLNVAPYRARKSDARANQMLRAYQNGEYDEEITYGNYSSDNYNWDEENEYYQQYLKEEEDSMLNFWDNDYDDDSWPDDYYDDYPDDYGDYDY